MDNGSIGGLWFTLFQTMLKSMNTSTLVSVGCCFVFFMQAGLASPAAPPVVLGFGAAGLTSLSFQGTEFLARGDFLVNGVTFADPNGHSTQGSTHCERTNDATTKNEKLIFAWGVVIVHYKSLANRLTLEIEVLNTSKATLSSLSFDALAIHLPSPCRQYDGIQPMLGTNIGAPTILPLDFADGSIVVANDDVQYPLLLGMPWSLNPPAKTIFPIRINTGRDSMYPDSLPWIARPIQPGAKDVFNISLRFSADASDIRIAAKDVIEKFVRLNEFTLRWPDRRPIGSLIIATADTHWKNNPRGWLLDPKIDVRTAAGVSEFHSRLLAWADHSISILKKMNAQGMITWDIEGEEFPHPATYIGDPTLSSVLAPEMDAVRDEYFRRFRNAGLRVGVTIRPQRIQRSGGTLKQLDVSDPFAELMRKIAFARKNWGATLFYIDSNGDPARPISSEIIAKLARTFPDVLLIPEQKTIAYYAKSAPYSESRGGFYSSPASVTDIYPKAFSVINTADVSIDQHYADLLAGVNRGDILMFRGWFDDPANSILKAVYSQSKFKP
jgi:hypothetical protein